MTDWIILRTAGRSTLGLAESLGSAGYDVWTPSEVKKLRKPRANVRREVTVPMLEGFVFAKAAHLADLLEMARSPVQRTHASFRVMRWVGRVPIIADGDLKALRAIEARRAVRKRAGYSFPRDAATRVKEGPFTGFTGIVVKSNDRKTKLSITVAGRSVPVEIPTSLLEIDEAYHARVAKAA